MTIPLAELPGAAPQGDPHPPHEFLLRTADQLYPTNSHVTEELHRLGFRFEPTTNPFILWKTGNPEKPVTLDTIHQLFDFIAKHGPVIISEKHELVIFNRAFMPNIEPATPEKYPGYTSVGREK